MDIRVLPKIDTPGLNRLQRAMNNPTSEQAITGMLNQWGSRMEAFTKRRFTLFSRGGGDWPPLAKSTYDARRSDRSGQTIGQAKRAAQAGIARARTPQQFDKAFKKVQKYNAFKTSILVDTGTLRRGLALQGPGNVREVFANGRFIGVRYGVAGGSHPGKLTVGRLAAIHQRGSGRLPQRKIIVRPDQQTIAGMRLDAVRAMKRIRGGA